MPSDERIRSVLTALQAASGPFQAAVTATIDELNALLADQRAPQEQRVQREAALLGSFAAGHFDVARFAELTASGTTLDGIRVGRLEQALEVLEELLSKGDDMYRVQVPPGGDLRETVRAAQAYRGRVFNAAHAIELLRSGGALKGPVGEALEYRNWSRPQRSLAPPLVVEVNGADLQVGGLAEYLDGVQKIVLLVDGPAAPAPLARLIAPSTYVVQTTRLEDLRALAEFPGPGIGAVLPEGCATFVHDPQRGPRLSQRLAVTVLPEPLRVAAAGGSLRQQGEELAWLTQLSKLGEPAPAEAAGAEAKADVAPADQLAAWLLRNTDLRE